MAPRPVTRSERSLLLEAAQELARRTVGVALRHFRSAFTVESKADGSPVTIADRGAEQAAREWITRRFPEDVVLGEEFGAHLPGAKRRWLIDPVDGTKTFVRGVPLWGTLIAICEEEAVLAGAAFFPAIDEMLAAATGLGCWWNGARAHVSATSAIEEAPLYPAITEAGGVFTDWRGIDTAFGGSIVATNAGLASRARELLGAGPAVPR